MVSYQTKWIPLNFWVSELIARIRRKSWRQIYFKSKLFKYYQLLLKLFRGLGRQFYLILNIRSVSLLPKFYQNYTFGIPRALKIEYGNRVIITNLYINYFQYFIWYFLQWTKLFSNLHKKLMSIQHIPLDSVIFGWIFGVLAEY